MAQHARQSSSGHSLLQANNIIITGGNYWQLLMGDSCVDASRRTITEAFEKHVFLDASHDSNDLVHLRRHFPTTNSILENLQKWACNSRDPSNVVWFHGPPKVGKSAIAVSFAEYLSKENRLAASFFFKRSDRRLGETERVFVPSSAYQMAFSVPKLQSLIMEVLDRDPLIFGQSMETQIEKLIIRPMRSANISRPLTIVIDGLDACPVENDFQHRLIATLGASAPPLLGRLKFFVTSREDHCICAAFGQGLMAVTKELRHSTGVHSSTTLRYFCAVFFLEPS